MAISKAERNKRINSAISQTNKILLKSKTRLANSKKVVAKTIAGDFGKTNKAEINAARNWVKQDSKRVKELESHLKNLRRMKK